jgi:glycosyltransferase involved in cell wall biosynthesis
MLRGERGHQRKEIQKLLDWLVTEPRFDVVNLPYTLLIGLAEPIKRALKTPVCCTLQGEDLFLEGLGEKHRRESLELIREASAYVDAFLPVSRYYAEFMPPYLGLPPGKMRVAPLGINTDGYARRSTRPPGPFTVGYLARIAPEKGLHVLVEAYKRLRARPGLGESRLVVAGYLAPEHRPYLDGLVRQLNEAGLGHHFEYRGELSRADKISFLHGLDVLSVPTTYHEPKGLFVLEAMAAGVPVVQPRHGAFPEMIESTGGGLIVPSGDVEALADGWLAIWRDPALGEALGKAGVSGVREHYSVARMADRAEEIYRELAAARV